MTEKRHDRPSKEPGSRVVCSALAAMGSSFSSSNTKMVFDSKAAAKVGLKKFDPSHKQKPYLCQHCGYWHLGNNTKVSTSEQTFIVPVKNELLVSSRLIPGTPLAEAVSNLSMSQFVPNEQMMERMALVLDQHKGFKCSDMKIFTLQPYAKTVAWAIHVPPLQPVFLLQEDKIYYSRLASQYWVC
jgi:hypothetical protein